MTDPDHAARLAHIHAVADYLAASRAAHHGGLEEQAHAVDLWEALDDRARDAVRECEPLPEWSR